MPKNFSLLSAFVSAPSSMDVQRRLVTTIIEKLPESVLDAYGLRLRAINWDLDVVPGIGNDAQSVISSQVGEEYDIYIGLLGAHFGSPTPRAGSGTEEEFDIAYQRYLDNPSSIRVLFYFHLGHADIFAIDLEQLSRVKTFKKKLEDSGVLFHQFKDDDALARAVSEHLSQLIQKQWDGHAWKVLSPRTDLVSVTQEAEATTSLVGLADPKPTDEFIDGDLEEIGVLDIIVTGAEAMEGLMETLGRISANHIQMTESLASVTGHMSDADQTPQRLKWAVNEAAQIMRVYAKSMGRELPGFKSQTDKVIDVTSNIVDFYFNEGIGDRQTIESTPEALRSLGDGIKSARSGIEMLRNQIRSLQGLTGEMKRAQRTTVALLDEYLAYTTVTVNRLDELQVNLTIRLSR